MTDGLSIITRKGKPSGQQDRTVRCALPEFTEGENALQYTGRHVTVKYSIQDHLMLNRAKHPTTGEKITLGTRFRLTFFFFIPNDCLE
ncbi:hypothetical protein FKM82_023834 [Ascaphus truei]